MSDERLGISGTIARKFLKTEITPLLALVGFLLGLFAVLITPREEEPQIDVTFANVFIPYPGATAEEVESLVSLPAERILSEIKGIDDIYSVSKPGMSVLTVQYEVGENRTDAIVRLYNKIFSNEDFLPQGLGVGEPIIKPKGIDDVPIVTLTLWTEDQNRGAHELAEVAHAIEAQLKRVPGTRDIYTKGAPDKVLHVKLDPQRLAGYGISLDELRRSLVAANTSYDAGELVGDNLEIPVQAGNFMTRPEEVEMLVVGVNKGAPVYLADVADIRMGPDVPEGYAWFGTGPAAGDKGIETSGEFPAVTISVAKKPGTNAVTIAERLIDRFHDLEGIYIPEGVNVTVTRNYGHTADAKAQKLMNKLMFATAIVVALVAVALGLREAFVVGMAVIITLAATLFFSWAWGFTLNRVSLFALIFSIGILVDDAIVVVENIHRHMQKGGKKMAEAIPLAVDEVGGPTILATFTVIAALMPMAFVTGLMGPYMSPIPINASAGMLISLAVAFVVTPWAALKVLKHGGSHEEEGGSDRLYRFFRAVIGPMLREKRGAPLRWLMLVVVLALIGGSIFLGVNKTVVLKMLPFDNKSEFQVVVDMPEGTSLEQTARVAHELGGYLRTVPEVTDYQAYVGENAPINFNGLVRQYYLREGANVADIQVNLVDKHYRERKSHDVARAVRGPLHEIAERFDANVKVVEVPPGPPVMSPLVAEIYGLDYDGQIEVAKQVRAFFEKTDGVVDVDDSVEEPSERLIVHVDRQKAAVLGVSQQSITAAINTILNGEDMGFLHGEDIKSAIPIRVEYPVELKSTLADLFALKVRSQSGALIPISELVEVERTTRERSIYHKNLLPVVMVTGDMAGELDSPLYGMFEIFFGIQDSEVFGDDFRQYLIAPPENPDNFGMKWDGEWQVTYETFRDMGIAYGVGLILIYLLVVAQFRSYLVPLIIMAPIPLTIIGVMPGHAILGAKFTATSMIGMIALAGIIVRNSILLVDFVNESVRAGQGLEEAVIRSAAVRAKPIVLTALAAMLGAFFILDDPIFRGLAISLIFGVLVSTLLTLVVIPVVYYAYIFRRPHRLRGEATS